MQSLEGEEYIFLEAGPDYWVAYLLHTPSQIYITIRTLNVEYTVHTLPEGKYLGNSDYTILY